MNPILHANPFIWSQFLLSMPKFHEYSAEVASRKAKASVESANNAIETVIASKTVAEKQGETIKDVDISESSSEDGL